MKKIAGPLRLEYSQYRELESFAQFGSDLDKETKAALEKGKRIVELLKQDQYSPMKVADQVLVIYAVSNNFAIDVPVTEIKRFEKELIEFANLRYSDVLDELKNASSLSDELSAKVDNLINEFKATFKC